MKRFIIATGRQGLTLEKLERRIICLGEASIHIQTIKCVGRSHAVMHCLLPILIDERTREATILSVVMHAVCPQSVGYADGPLGLREPLYGALAGTVLSLKLRSRRRAASFSSTGTSLQSTKRLGSRLCGHLRPGYLREDSLS